MGGGFWICRSRRQRDGANDRGRVKKDSEDYVSWRPSVQVQPGTDGRLSSLQPSTYMTPSFSHCVDGEPLTLEDSLRPENIRNIDEGRSFCSMYASFC
ncbi:hypothetical protein ARMGADRAFT_1018161 [Armillaria gallica]|uniref:Uncharacterized protein n=1 Tax=Armillaria gallica TaxID=47427 RepID=A0A2H3DA30_ARMGA|nr:hypothetical protein ARMGADRAFT_1018161 [Armillaria gallica]